MFVGSLLLPLLSLFLVRSTCVEIDPFVSAVICARAWVGGIGILMDDFFSWCRTCMCSVYSFEGKMIVPSDKKSVLFARLRGFYTDDVAP